MRIALYARVSTKDKQQEYENQLLQLRKFVARNEGWEIVKEYADKVTGATTDRPRFKQMFADASRKEFDLVLFWSLDRFSREGVLVTLSYLNRLEEYGVQWFSYTEEYLRSIGVFKDAVLAILATIAKQERIRLSERTVAGLEKAKSKGKTLGRQYATVKTESRPNPVLVEDVLRLRKEGKTLKQIARACKASEATISRMLKREGYSSKVTPKVIELEGNDVIRY